MTGRAYKVDAATGNSLRMLRRQSGLSRRQVATRAHTTPRFLSEVERGKRGAPPSYFARVAAACASFSTAPKVSDLIDALGKVDPNTPITLGMAAIDWTDDVAEIVDMLTQQGGE